MADEKNSDYNETAVQWYLRSILKYLTFLQMLLLVVIYMRKVKLIQI